MKIAILDLELNQPSNKIIQIGVCCLDVKTGKINPNSFNIIVNPNESINPFIIDLTKITNEMVENGYQIEKALTDMWSWIRLNGCKKHVAAWGSDWSTVLRQSRDLGIQFEWPHILDVKEMSSILRCAFPNEKAKGGLFNTMKLFNLDFIGTQHNAIDDAINTARLLYQYKSIFQKFINITQLINTNDNKIS